MAGAPARRGLRRQQRPGTGGQRKVEPVVDDEEGAGLFATSCEFAGELERFAVGEPFLPQLDAGDAAGESGIDVVDETAFRLVGVGD